MRLAAAAFFSISTCFAFAQGPQSPMAMADSLLAASQYNEALAAIDRAEPNPETYVLLQNKKAEILLAQGNLAAAEQTIGELLRSDIPQSSVKGIVMASQGFLLLNKGRQDLAIETLTEALKNFKEGGSMATAESAQCLAYLSLAYLASGKLSQAEENGVMALQTRMQLFGDNDARVAASYNDLGLLYSQTDREKALEYYEKAQAIYQRVYGQSNARLAVIASNMGALYRDMELYGDAVNNFEDAQARWQKIYPAGHPNEAFVLRNLGITYDRMGNKKAAAEYFNQALALYRKTYGAKHPDIASTLNDLGTLQLEARQYVASLVSFQQALVANVVGFAATEITTNPSPENYYNGMVLLYSLRLKAQGFEELHLGKTLKRADLEQALTALYLCDSLIDDLRQHSTNERDKLALGALATEVYEDGVRVATTLADITLAPAVYNEKAFYFAEKSKSAILLESIAESDAKSFAGIPDVLVAEEKNLKSAIAFMTQKLSLKPESAEEEKYLREALFGLNLEYNAFIKKLEKDYPNYFNLKFNASSPSIAQLQKLLNNEQAVISFFIAEKNARIYQFIITARGFTVQNLTLPADFDRDVRGFTNSLLYNDFKTYETTGKSLRKVLVPRLPTAITEVVFIPSGRLGTLPFEALFYKPSAGRDFSSTPFLLNRYAVGYEFSAGLILQKAKRESKSENPSIFLCAPVSFPDRDNLSPLPATAQEVEKIGSLFADEARAVVTYQQANESRVKMEDLTKYNYVHLATHGIVDEERPELSRIFLHTGDHEDGNLYAGEIYNLKLNANLAVLSACQTGLGKISKGEGVIGLSRALVYAGAQNLMVSFWSVADESTAQLMTHFYEKLLREKNPNYRRELQYAKQQLMREGKFSLPFYWAPFVVIGF
jgi:CHAT domain-containing protein/tetratricopeptide (TPR) repeat protein